MRTAREAAVEHAKDVLVDARRLVGRGRVDEHLVVARLQQRRLDEPDDFVEPKGH